MNLRMCVLVGCVAALAACDNGPSAVETRTARAEAPVALMAAAESTPTVEAAVVEASAERPVLTRTRTQSVDDKARRLFDRNGADFGAETVEDYLGQVEAFVRRPPTGTETARRPNGDTLYYHAASNTFVVTARDGTARTMFKPRGGAAYWEEQRAAAPTFGRRRDRSAD